MMLFECRFSNIDSMKTRIICVLLLAIPSISFAQARTVNDLAWLTGRWEGTMAKGPGVAREAYETNFKQAMRLKSIAGNKYIFENMIAYDKNLMSTQPRVTTYERIDDNNWIGRSDIIGSDGKPAVIEVRYRRIAELKEVGK
jgi:hypothetical protein